MLRHPADRVSAAILTGAILVGIALWQTFHWELVPEHDALYRLDRWTGRIDICLAHRGDDQNYEVNCAPRANPEAP